MSNKTLPDTPTETAAEKSRSSFRRIWLVSGFVLWGLVFAAVAAIVVLRHRQRSSNEAEAPPAIVLSDAANGSASSGQQTPPLLPPWSPAGIEDFTFTERSGKKVTNADLLGHPWLISFIFTRCAGPCPRVSSQMSELQDLLKGTDVRLVTLTVDPDYDTTNVLSHYAEAYRADPKRWLYLTGDKRKTYQLINNSFLMPVKEYTGKDREPGYEVMHSTNILLVNEKGVVVNKYNALDEVDLARLRHDLKPYLNAKSIRDGYRNEPTPPRPMADTSRGMPGKNDGPKGQGSNQQKTTPAAKMPAPSSQTGGSH
jgi:protein SCO1